MTNRETAMKEIQAGLIWGFGLVALALVGTLARKAGYIDQDTVKRLVACTTGLWLAWYGNRMPKTLVPGTWARKARRFSAWSMVVSGLVYAGLWLFAPLPAAATGGMAALVTGIAVTLGYCLTLRRRAKAT